MHDDPAQEIIRETTRRAYARLIPSGLGHVVQVAPREYQEDIFLAGYSKSSRTYPPEIFQTLWRRGSLAGRGVDLVLFGSSLTRLAHPVTELRRAGEGARYVLVYDNLMSPQPSWMKDDKKRTHIEWPMLLEMAREAGLTPVGETVGDVLGRKLFLMMPRWLWWLVEPVTKLIEYHVAPHLPMAYARHSGWMFRSRSGKHAGH